MLRFLTVWRQRNGAGAPGPASGALAAGTWHAALPPMRVVVLAVVLLAGCLGVGSGSGTGSRPGVMPMLSELPGDPGKRDAILDQANATPGPEGRKPLATPRLRKAETSAATAAAVIGSMFSKTQNVTLGMASTFDEDTVVGAPPPQQRRLHPTDGSDAPKQPPVELEDAGTLVPWLRLK